MKEFSRIQGCIDVLSILSQRRMYKLKNILYELKINPIFLKEDLLYLIQQGLVEKKLIEKERNAYNITPQGLSILEAFMELKTNLPPIEVCSLV